MSDIACDCSIDFDVPTLHNVEVRTARKEYRCGECRESIEPGQRYEHVRGLWDGRWSTFRTCLTCRRIREDYCPYGWEYGHLSEHIWECIGLDYISGETIDDE